VAEKDFAEALRMLFRDIGITKIEVIEQAPQFPLTP
jgi:hypothetical protein